MNYWLKHLEQDAYKAFKKFGWTQKEVERSHERDYDRTWTETVFVDKNGNFLFEENSLSTYLVEELIRISND